MPRGKIRRARVLKVDPRRFAHGLGWLESPSPASNAGPPSNEPTVHIDIIRPADLVALSVDAIGCELVSDGVKPARLRPLDGYKTPCLVVRYAFQHTGEEATYEGQSGKTNTLVTWDNSVIADPPPAPYARPNPPVGARAARATRLVFLIPATETIEFSTAGILAAMGRLALKVHDLALPGDAPAGLAGSAPSGLASSGPLTQLVLGDLVGTVSNDAITLAKATKKELRSLGAPPVDTLASVVFQARELRRARTLLQSRTGLAGPRTSIQQQPILGGLFGGLTGPIRDAGTHSRPPRDDETAIEAPFRLIISPSDEARWAHANEPVAGGDDAQHVELWHSRLGNLGTRPDGSPYTDEKNAGRRIVRAIWARDRDRMATADWQNPASGLPKHANDDPFRMSLDGADRHMLVQQSAETLSARRQRIAPVPVAARALWLSGLGAWLNLHGAWDTTPYSHAHLRSILSWDHLAPMGRDQFVLVVYPGYLYPWGHRTALVKVTERKMKDVSPSLAALYQRKFLVIGEPRRTYADRHELPFIEASIRPAMTPPLDEPSGVDGDDQDKFFWPRIDGQPFSFVIDTLDHDGKPARLHMPLLWVAESYREYANVDTAYDGSGPLRTVEAQGQPICFAPLNHGGDTRVATDKLRFLGRAALGGSTPRMSSAEVRVPAVEALSPAGSIPIAYHPAYASQGFALPANTGEIWAQVLVSGELAGERPDDPTLALPQLQFGAGAPSASDRAGGFLTPNVPMRGLSRSNGVVGDANGMANQQFDPKTFFGGSLPKLFGLIDLSELAVKVDSDLLRMPKVISEFMGRIEGLITEMGRAGQAIGDAIVQANDMLASAAAKDPAVRAQWMKQAQDALDAANSVQNVFGDLEQRLQDFVGAVTSQGAANPAVSGYQAKFLNAIDDAMKGIEDLASRLPPFMAQLLRAIARSLQVFVKDVATLAQDIENYVKGMADSGSLARVRFEWKPKVASWPAGDPLIEVKPDSLLLALQAQAGLQGKGDAHVLAELRDFTLHLFPKAELIRLKFSHFSFVTAGTNKPEVDIVIDDIAFLGVLSFVEDIKKLIPLDGFSDPPNISIKPEGLTAGFSLALPDLAIGMFSITNMSLGADVQVPFLGKAVTVGFNFCTRERPFTLAVAFLGGGGWCGIRASAHGLEVLEVGLEAGACIAVDLAVASGSVSAMIGVYIRIESEAGSISGYFRLRGEVDVLGLISAAIELYMELKYQYDTGKLIGQASITVNVSVIGISKSVKISAQRTFAGSNGDPSFLELMGAQSGRSPAWNSYCMAFMGE